MSDHFEDETRDGDSEAQSKQSCPACGNPDADCYDWQGVEGGAAIHCWMQTCPCGFADGRTPKNAIGEHHVG